MNCKQVFAVVAFAFFALLFAAPLSAQQAQQKGKSKEKQEIKQKETPAAPAVSSEQQAAPGTVAAQPVQPAPAGEAQNAGAQAQNPFNKAKVAEAKAKMDAKKNGKTNSKSKNGKAAQQLTKEQEQREWNQN